MIAWRVESSDAPSTFVIQYPRSERICVASSVLAFRASLALLPDANAVALVKRNIPIKAHIVDLRAESE
jgi:hypothetical protein